MPWKIAKVKGGYKVVQKSTGPHPGKALSKKPLTHEQARRQLAAVYANTKGEHG